MLLGITLVFFFFKLKIVTNSIFKSTLIIAVLKKNKNEGSIFWEEAFEIIKCN